MDRQQFIDRVGEMRVYQRTASAIKKLNPNARSASAAQAEIAEREVDEWLALRAEGIAKHEKFIEEISELPPMCPGCTVEEVEAKCEGLCPKCYDEKHNGPRDTGGE